MPPQRVPAAARAHLCSPVAYQEPPARLPVGAVSQAVTRGAAPEPWGLKGSFLPATGAGPRRLERGAGRAAVGGSR